MASVEHRPLTSGDEESGGHSPGMKLLFGNQYQLRQQHTAVMRAVILLAVALVALIVVVTLPVTKDHPKLTTNSVAPPSRRRALFGVSNIFGVKRPDLSIGNLTLTQMHFEMVGGLPKLDIALTAIVNINNPNRKSLDYDESQTTINYAGTTLAEATVPSGSCPGHGTVQMIASINVMPERLLLVPSIVRPLLTGTVPFTSVTVVSGRVTVLFFIRIRVRVRLTCDFDVSVTARTVQNVSCQTSIEL